MSLYDILGLRPDADEDEIKAAHRQMVKTTHPDAGGKREDFDRVQRAYGILSDRHARDNYDRTGEEKITDPVALLRAQGLEVVAGKMNVLMLDPKVDPRHFDLVLGIRELIGAQEQQVAMHIQQCRDMQLRLRQFAKRLKRKAKGQSEDMIAALLNTQIAGHHEQIIQLEGTIKILAAGKELIEEYLYETDPAQQKVYMQGLGGMYRGTIFSGV